MIRKVSVFKWLFWRKIATGFIIFGCFLLFIVFALLALGYFSNNDLAVRFSFEKFFKSLSVKAAVGSFFIAALFIVSGIFIGKKFDSLIKERMTNQSQPRI